VKGWDSWGMLTLLALRPRDVSFFLLSVATALLAGAALQLFLTAAPPRPRLGRAAPGLPEGRGEGRAFQAVALGRARCSLDWPSGRDLRGGSALALPDVRRPAPPRTTDGRRSPSLGAGRRPRRPPPGHVEVRPRRVALARDEARNARGGYRVARSASGSPRTALGIASSGWLWLLIQCSSRTSASDEPQTFGGSPPGRGPADRLRPLGDGRVGFWEASSGSTRPREEDAPPQPVLSPSRLPRSGESSEAAAS